MRLQAPGEATHDPIGKKKGNVRIFIVDDHPIVRDGLKRLLSLEDDFEIVGEAGDGWEVLEKVRDTDPDVLLLDLKMPNLNGLSVLEFLQRSRSSTRVIVFTASEAEDEFVQAMRLGCRGILLKQTDPDLIVKSIRKVHAGEIWLGSQATAAVMNEFSNGLRSNHTNGVAGGRVCNPLSAREHEIVSLVAQGLKNKEVAARLFISEQTVKNHLHNIFDKLGVSDRLELALYEVQKGLRLIGESVPARMPQRGVPAPLQAGGEVDPGTVFFSGRDA
jgi:DNA-binding NarL/FixJ family response regulator